jgi:hypothetical protein
MAIVVDGITKKDSRGDVFNLIMSQAEVEVNNQRKAGNVTSTKTSDSGGSDTVAAIPTSQVAALEQAGLVDTAPPVNSGYINDIVSGNDPTKDSGDHSDSLPAVMLSLGYVESDRMPGLFMSDYGFWVNSKGQFVNGDKEVLSSGAVGGTPLTPEELEAEGLPPLFDPLNVKRTEDATSSSEVLGKDDPTDPDHNPPSTQEPLIPLTPITLPEREPVVNVTAPTPATPAPTTPVKIPTPTPTPKPPAPPQQQMGSSTSTYSLPVELADILQMDLDEPDLLKYLQRLKEHSSKKRKETNPIYAAQGGSIDDLIEYLRS